ncbi:MAG TPA: sugar transferase [Anaerolineales bacterium]|jgi:lipopolysaccharide/colanic/teichoic acid biosynthesis glycosyltransferase|nr:sugar transferase [Anaerolineales bacterium]
MELNILERPKVLLFRRDYQVVKRIFDVTVCLLALPAVLPIIAVCAALIWLDDGKPVLFTQLRTGKGGQRFKVYKFRTMVRDAEALKEKYAHLNKLSWPDFKAADDPRITRIGKFLRKASLDELPQLINVLRGEMSLVGPRPSSFDVSTYDLRHTERLEVLPGITGLAQINGRSDLGFDEKLVLDVEYVKRQSLRLDIKILLRTVVVVFRQRGE